MNIVDLKNHKSLVIVFKVNYKPDVIKIPIFQKVVLKASLYGKVVFLPYGY